jgi:hypothetical protein
MLDARAKRLAEIQGVLTHEVKFGGGLLGHLEKGGTFAVQQHEVAPGYWEGALTRVHMKGKALFFKTIAVQTDETYTNSRLLPENTTLQNAVTLVSREQAYRTASLNSPGFRNRWPSQTNSAEELLRVNPARNSRPASADTASRI